MFFSRTFKSWIVLIIAADYSWVVVFLMNRRGSSPLAPVWSLPWTWGSSGCFGKLSGFPLQGGLAHKPAFTPEGLNYGSRELDQVSNTAGKNHGFILL